MDSSTFIRVKEKTAAAVCGGMTLRPDAKALLRNGMSPDDFVRALLGAKQYTTAIDFMAHALGAREAIWWGALCFQHATGDAMTAGDRSACRAAVHWVIQPSEQVRLAAKVAAEGAGVQSPAGSLAMAAFQPSGNWAQAKATALTVKLICLTMPPASIPEAQKRFAELSIGVAQGRHPYPVFAAA